MKTSRLAWGIPGHLSRVAEAPYTELAGLSARVGLVEAAERVRRAAVSTATSMSLGPSVVMSNQASQIRAGIHTGECELLDADIGGIAVHIAARILGHASAGDILVDRTVRDLVVGSGTGHRGPRQHRAARRARHLATPAGRSPRCAGGIGRGRTGVNATPPARGPRCAGWTAPWR